MTLQMMQQFGVTVVRHADNHYTIPKVNFFFIRFPIKSYEFIDGLREESKRKKRERNIFFFKYIFI